MSHYAKTALSLFLILLAGGNLFAQGDQAPLLSDLDIPLMQGFQEEEGSRLVFDTPQGRIIEVRASGPHEKSEVLDYYKIVLPSLSWATLADISENCNGTSLFCIMAHRDGEILTLKIRELKGSKGKTIIYFSVNPE
ncbi:MAG: hypothetical protein KAJ40_00800 [Alphaproteobacteria bacterium]|nr:hypothetical protein [Alphaproteobacteria bacterium]